MNEFDINLNWW